MTRRRLENLEEWDRVLEQLEEWKGAGQLDRHQDDLLWLLRYDSNWRLREAALEAMASLQTPEPELIRKACSILLDDSLYWEVRILSVEAVAPVLAGEQAAGALTDSLADEVRQCMRTLQASAQPPVLHLALQRVLSQIK